MVVFIESSFAWLDSVTTQSCISGYSSHANFKASSSTDVRIQFILDPISWHTHPVRFRLTRTLIHSASKRRSTVIQQDPAFASLVSALVGSRVGDVNLRQTFNRIDATSKGHIDRRDLEAYALNNGLPVNYVEHFLSAVLRTGVSAGVASVGSTQRFSGGRTTCSLSSSHVGVPESSSGSGSGNEDEPEVTFELFTRFVRGREDALRRAFKLFDRDRDGRISFQDLDRSLSHVMVSCPRTRCSYRCRQKAVKELIRKMDADGNKTVEFGEFRDFFMLLPQTEMMVDYWLSAAAAGGCCDVGGRVTLRHAELATAKGASPWGHLIAGALAGAASRTATAPLETLRLAAMAGTVEASTPLLAAAQQLMAVHGWRGLYRGNGINVLRSAPAKALDFFAFDFFKTRFGDGGLASTFLSAGCAGALSMLLLYPLEVVRSRMTIDVAGKYGGSAVQALQIIVREQGARSLFRGLIPSVAAIFPEAAITYGLHDQLKRSYRRLHHNREPGILPSLGFGVFSAFSGQLVSYPLETVSRRLQVAGGRSSATAIVAALLKEGGPTALYRGLGAATLRLVPMALISFGTYEVARATLINMETNSANARAEWEANQLTAHLQPLHAD